MIISRVCSWAIVFYMTARHGDAISLPALASNVTGSKRNLLARAIP